MRNLIIALLLLNSAQLFSQGEKTIAVDNAKQFLEAIGPDRTIQIRAQAIYISDLVKSTVREGDYYLIEGDETTIELTISNVSHLKIIGLGSTPNKILTRPEFGEVLTFSQCSDLTIENIEGGHNPVVTDECAGGVLFFDQCENVRIQNSVLFGSGIQGIYANGSKHFICENVKIHDCSQAFMSFDDCQDFEFSKCTFENNTGIDQITIINCLGFSFSNCHIQNVKAQIVEGEAFSLFNCAQSLSIHIEGCKIENNHINYLTNNCSAITIEDTEIENNQFDDGLCPE
jgi:hypothetical protein